MTDFYWGIFAATGSIDAYMEYKNCSERLAYKNERNHHEYEGMDEDFSRQWDCSEDYRGWRVE